MSIFWSLNVLYSTIVPSGPLEYWFNCHSVVIIVAKMQLIFHSRFTQFRTNECDTLSFLIFSKNWNLICPNLVAQEGILQNKNSSIFAKAIQYFYLTFVYLRIEFVQSECEISREEMYIRAEYISLLDSTFRYFDHHFLFKSRFLVQKKDREIFICMIIPSILSLFVLCL